jgi:hypothetical protein
MKLSKVIFWDTEYNSIDWDKNARYVIGRVLMYGTVEDYWTIKGYYGLDRIQEEMLQERYLDPRTLSFLSCILNTPQEAFRCYSEIQSQRGHWNF